MSYKYTTSFKYTIIDMSRYVFSKDFVLELLKRCKGIGEAESHDKAFEKTVEVRRQFSIFLLRQSE